jgi:hypothetical protein
MRSLFWGSKVAEDGGAFAAGKISNFGRQKVGFEIIFGLREENLHVKAGPSPTTFLLVPKASL